MLIPDSPKYINSRVYCKTGGNKYENPIAIKIPSENKFTSLKNLLFISQDIKVKISVNKPKAAIVTANFRFNAIKNIFMPLGS